jgi:PleD family two-component response regulator
VRAAGGEWSGGGSEQLEMRRLAMAKEEFHAMKQLNRCESRETQDRLTGFASRAHAATGGASASLPDSANAPILVVTDDDAIARDLERNLLGAGLSFERVASMAAGCESARSRRFQVVVTTAVLPDGTWKRLTDLASHHSPSFVVIVLADASDLKRWAGALEDGALEVLDRLNELPKVSEVAKRALWAAYLDGTGPCPEASSGPSVS